MSDMHNNTDELWDEGQVAACLEIATKTLRQWRCQKKMLPYAKIGRLIRYRRSDVEAFVNAQLRRSTSENGDA